MARVLIVDDQVDVLRALRLLLKSERHESVSADSPPAALEILSGTSVDLTIVDLNYSRDTTSGIEGLELISAIRDHDPTLPVVAMTAWGSVDLAVEAMRHGASDFVQKPWENARLLSIVRNQCELAESRQRQEKLQAENQLLRGSDDSALIAESAAMKPVLDLIGRVGPSDANVLVTGEHGTGKEVVAQTLHQVSARSKKPIVPVNVGGLAEGLFESEMFGHLKGAFTGADSDRIGRFELADGGTLFLDEIANISSSQQARLLRVLETGEVERVGSSRPRKVDVRILSATNADLSGHIEAGEFREDLLFRLNTIEIRLPPLRERGDDIDRLAGHFLARASQRYRKALTGFSSSAREALRRHSWPGNVRELDHVVQRAVLMASGGEIQPADLGLDIRSTPGRSLDDMSLEEVEAYLIKRTIERCDGNVADAGKELGLSRSAIYRRVQKYGL